MPEESIVYRPQPRWMRRLLPVATIALLALPLLSWIVTGELRPQNFVLPVSGVLLIVMARLVMRSRFVVDASGVDLARRRSRVLWERVDHVRRPGSWDPVVVLVFTDGEECRTPYPPNFADRMASLGQVSIKD